MKRVVLAAAVFAFTALVCCGTGLYANPKPSPPKPTPVAKKKTVTKVVNGRSVRVTAYPRHQRWDSRCWFATYRCYGYYNGFDRQWYYWYEPTAQFLPIRLMAVYRPTTPGVTLVARVPMGPGVMPPAGPVLPPGASPVPPEIPETGPGADPQATPDPTAARRAKTSPPAP